MRYGYKVKKDKTKSLVYDLEQEEKDFTNKKAAQQFSKREALCLLLIVLAILINVVGIFTLNWSFNEMSANFLMIGIMAGFVGGLGFNGTFDALIEGMQNVLFGALVVGFAKGIIVLLEDSKVIDTIVHGMTTLLTDVPSSFVILVMFVFQFFLNFFIPSGSGQALTTMPLMVPIADLLHINRQMTVLAFQYGDAISNVLFPTSAILMGHLLLERFHIRSG